MQASTFYAGMVCLALLLASANVLGHGKETHAEKKDAAQAEGAGGTLSGEQATAMARESLLNEVAKDYEETAGPVLGAKCADCHGEPESLPWYYAIPGVSHLIDADMEEGRKHLDLRGGFPFGGHGTPLEDVRAIAKALEEDSMPPLRYLMMHWDGSLTEAEAKTVLGWTARAEAALDCPSGTAAIQDAPMQQGGAHASTQAARMQSGGADGVTQPAPMQPGGAHGAAGEPMPCPPAQADAK